MSDHEVFYRVADALRDMLYDAFDEDPPFHPFPNTRAGIGFLNPTETARLREHQLSMWLYQVTENADLKNQPPLRVSETVARKPPLALNLYFLVTPFADSSGSNEENNLLLLGKTMQVLYDNASVLLRYAGAGDEEECSEELRIILCRLSLEELTRIWEALKEPYRLSVCYQVQVTRIDSKRGTRAARVLDRQAAFGEDVKPQVGGRA